MENKISIRYQPPPFGKQMLADGNKKSCGFQVTCKKCYEIIYQDYYLVSILRNGAPKQSELKRVFSYSEFDVVKPCPCCGKSDFERHYYYEPIQVLSKDSNDENDLPF